MKYILLKGASSSGKSTTMKAVCKVIKPDRIQRLRPGIRTLEDCDVNVDMANGTFVVQKGEMIILTSAGSPTEQGIRITVLIEMVIELRGRVDIAIVSMRKYEQKEGFDTPMELNGLGECLHIETIRRIPDDFVKSAEWNSRIVRIVNVLENAGVEVGALV